MERVALLTRLASHSEDHRGRLPDPGLGSRSAETQVQKQTSVTGDREAGRVLEAPL